MLVGFSESLRVRSAKQKGANFHFQSESSTTPTNSLLISPHHRRTKGKVRSGKCKENILKWQADCGWIKGNEPQNYANQPQSKEIWNYALVSERWKFKSRTLKLISRPSLLRTNKFSGFSGACVNGKTGRRTRPSYSTSSGFRIEILNVSLLASLSPSETSKSKYAPFRSSPKDTKKRRTIKPFQNFQELIKS